MAINTAFGFETSSVNSWDRWKIPLQADLSVAARRYQNDHSPHNDKIYQVKLNRFKQDQENHVFKTNLKRVISYIPILTLYVSFEEGLKAAWLESYPDRGAIIFRSLVSIAGLGIIFLIPDLIILAQRVLTTSLEDTAYLNIQRRFEYIDIDRMDESEKKSFCQSFCHDIQNYYKVLNQSDDSTKASKLLCLHNRTMHNGHKKKAEEYFFEAAQVLDN